MGRQPNDPPYYSTFVEGKKEYKTQIPRPVGDTMKEKSNSIWIVESKFEEDNKGEISIRLYWTPHETKGDSNNG